MEDVTWMPLQNIHGQTTSSLVGVPRNPRHFHLAWELRTSFFDYHPCCVSHPFFTSPLLPWLLSPLPRAVHSAG